MNRENDLKRYSNHWIEVGGLKLIGPTMVELLESVRQCNSVRRAALEMKISYRKAWQLVDHMNAQLSEPVVLLNYAGKRNARAEVTAYGISVITASNVFFKN